MVKGKAECPSFIGREFFLMRSMTETISPMPLHCQPWKLAGQARARFLANDHPLEVVSMMHLTFLVLASVLSVFLLSFLE